MRYAGKKAGLSPFEVRQGLKAEGIFTVQYPDEKLAVPNASLRAVSGCRGRRSPGSPRSRLAYKLRHLRQSMPAAVYLDRARRKPGYRTPNPGAGSLFIDIDICMNCGFCAEFCPFDAIKMDHDYELASYDRTANHIFDKQKLSKPFSYWKTIAPTTAAEEAEARGGWEHPDVIKERKKAERGGGPPPRPAAAAPQPAAQTAPAEAAAPAAVAEAPAAAAPAVDEEAAKAERLRKREEALARKRAKEQQEKGE
ncbi:MAG: 4Fe-4S binding protein [Anaerolineae bacterium]